MKITFIYFFLILFILYVIITKIYKFYRSECNSFENKFKLDVDEIIPKINYNINNPQDIHYLFWTGGYDSTFRLCQVLLLLDKPVQPIYIMCGNVDSEFTISRQNIQKEIETMKNIRKIILQKNSHLSSKFLPTQYVISIKKNSKITKAFNRLHKRLGYFSRSVSQYERMARFSSDYEYPIEVGLENCGTGLDEATKFFREDIGTNCKLKHQLPNKFKDLAIFNNFRFPICHLTKEEMRNIAINYKFFYILQMTWSCWFPKNGRPCGHCQMCKKRIIY